MSLACRTCGHAEDAHPYRHPFVPALPPRRPA
jgi:hypothetical protein